MTPYSRGKTSTVNSLVSVPRLIGASPPKLCYKIQTIKNPDLSCQRICVAKFARFLPVTYREQGDYEYWGTQGGIPVYQVSHISDSDVAKAIVECNQDAASKSYKDWDALTEACELRQAVDLFRGNTKAAATLFRKAINGIPLIDAKKYMWLSYKQIGERLVPRSIRSFAKLWLQYRYAIMPLVYSFNDIRKVIRRSHIIVDKASRSVSSTSLSSGPFPNPYIRKEVQGTVSVRSTVACRYSTSKVAQMSRIGINPFVTAWELLPYSFVLDWFINMSDFIATNFSASFAEETMACSSTRISKIENYYLDHSIDQSISGAWTTCGAHSSTCWGSSGSWPPAPSYSMTEHVDGLLRSVVTESYHRTLFARGSANQLLFSPNVRWRRMIDGAALSIKPLRAIAKFLS